MTKKLYIPFLKFLHISIITFPILFLLGGYLYEAILLKEFSVNVDNYFFFNDYISGGFHILLFNLIAVAFISFVSFFAGVRSSFNNENKKNSQRAINLGSSTLLVGSLLLVAVGAFYHQKMAVYLGIIFIIFSMLLLLIINFIENSSEIGLCIIICFFFFSIIYVQADTQAEKIKQMQAPVEHYHFKGYQTKAPLILISNSSQYYFFYNIKSKSIIIIPQENIDYITIADN